MAAISQKQLTQWYEAHATDLMLYARQWNADQQAEDVVQDAFIRLLKQRKCPDNVRAWLFRVVRNSSISRARRLRQRLQARQKLAGRHSPWFESASDDLIDAYRNLLDERKGIARAVVTAASPLSESEQRAIAARLEKSLGQRIVMDVREDPALIGGLVVRIGSTVYDGSVLQQLSGFKERLLAR